ncbi:MAG: ribosome small subunit-dependent GTPase A [Candidatus Moranbacteria bacterium]|nr:ribosome small subunit-dependent GTPase A [Candidatus Moranbacteria bacterium]
MNTMTLEDLGYDDFFESSRAGRGSEGVRVARVIAQARGGYRVKDADGEYVAKVTGKRMFMASSREDYPAVGDWVELSDVAGGQAVIQDILPRRTVIRRKSVGKGNGYEGKSDVQIIATNVDVAFVVEAVDRDYNLNRMERYCAIARDGGVRSAVILNKTDLISEEERASKIAEIRGRFGDIDVMTTSVATGEGVSTVRDALEKGKTYGFLGSSGVGKSSLINRLLETDGIRTGAIGSHSERGKHVTTAREMYFLGNGGIVIDNPGMREVGLTDTETGIEESFDEIASLSEKCRFADCTHEHEPGCAVLAAIESGTIDRDKYDNYLRLRKEADFFGLTAVQKRSKDRQFGKFIDTAKKGLKKYGQKGKGK